MSYHFRLTARAVSEKTIMNVGKDMDNPNPGTLLALCLVWSPNSLLDPSNIKHRVTLCCSNSISRYIPKRHVPQNLHVNIH